MVGRVLGHAGGTVQICMHILGCALELSIMVIDSCLSLSIFHLLHTAYLYLSS